MSLSTHPFTSRRFASACLMALCAFLVFASSALAKREIPVGLYNVNNQVMNSTNYRYAIRFVVDRDTTMHRFISGFNLEGTDYLGGREGYSNGTGGTINAKLVAVNADGTPDTSRVLAEETVGAITRYRESKAEYGVPGITQLLHFNTGGVRLAKGEMYAMVFRNVGSNPSASFFSENSPTVKESQSGPNGKNTLDPDAPGAIAGLDPREAVAWSKDGGSNWVWGRRAGEGPTAGAYAGSSSSDDGTRLPWYGWQTSPGATPESNQPYYAYTARGRYTLRLAGVPRITTLTEAGGYAPAGSSVGVVTVRNTTTGETGRTGSLGSGIAKGDLDNPVTVKPGHIYEISNSGTVLKAEGDTFIRSTFGIGGGAWSFQTAGQNQDRAELFALPHPWFGPSSKLPADGGQPGRGYVSLVGRMGPKQHHPARAATPRRIRCVRRLRVAGRVVGSQARRGMRVRIQARKNGHWKTVARARVRSKGRFRTRRKLRVRCGLHSVRLRALARGVGRSRVIKLRVRRSR